MIHEWKRKTPYALLWVAIVALTKAQLEISEFLASNDSGFADEDGDMSDWIEIHNKAGAPVDLTGLYLTDDAGDPTQWAFPAMSLAADSYVVVFASSKNRRNVSSQLHTNFKLSAGGEYLGLYAADGSTVLFEYGPEYPPQTTDQSYGIDSSGNIAFFVSPSPWMANAAGEAPLARDVVASVDRGFYSSPFPVSLGSSSSQVSIRFTMNGSEPTSTTGILYEPGSPIQISTTTVLRAAAFATNVVPSVVSTYTYIFLDDIIRQPATIEGFPNGYSHDTSRFGESVEQDFAMDPNVVNEYADEIFQGMTSIPTMSIVSSLSNIFDIQEGFYFSTDDTETACSMEILNANTPDENEQANVGVEAHSHNRQKRSLRLNFRERYGTKVWETDFFQRHTPLHSDSVTNRHKTLILRAGSNRSYARASNPDRTSYTIDEFYRSSQIAMSGVGSHGAFVHLYLNGVYWGLYNLVERPDEEFQTMYFGGEDDDWFFTNPSGAGSANSTRFDYLVNTLSTRDMNDPDNFAEMQEYLNLERFADYVLLAFWIGLTDWPYNNWYVANRNDISQLGPTPTVFYAWDGEYSLDLALPFPRARREREGASIQFDFRFNAYSPAPILILWHALIVCNDFRDMLDDRVAVHTNDNGGALTDAAAMARWNTLNTHIATAVIGESARWGDSLSSLKNYPETQTRDGSWQTQVEHIRTVMEGNTERFLDEYELLMDPPLRIRALAKLAELGKWPLSKLRQLIGQ